MLLATGKWHENQLAAQDARAMWITVHITQFRLHTTPVPVFRYQVTPLQRSPWRAATSQAQQLHLMQPQEVQWHLHGATRLSHQHTHRGRPNTHHLILHPHCCAACDATQTRRWRRVSSGAE